MPSVTIPDELFQRLATRAAAQRVTVEQLIAPLLALAAESGGKEHPVPSPSAMVFVDWKKEFDAWMTDVQTRFDHYPQGFVMDDSRETIYDGCGE